MSDLACDDLGIPEHLHTKDRPEVSQFGENEKLFRRFPEKDPGGNKNILIKGGKEVLSINVFSTREMSCNREKFCSCPEDVLYNTSSKNHFNDYGIISIDTINIEKFEEKHPEIDNTKYGLKILHKPEKCMYPHTQINCIQNNTPVREISPSSIKTKIKELYLKNSTIFKLPKTNQQ